MVIAGREPGVVFIFPRKSDDDNHAQENGAGDVVGAGARVVAPSCITGAESRRGPGGGADHEADDGLRGWPAAVRGATASSIEVVLVNGQKIEFDSGARLTVKRPNKLRAERVGDVISQSLYYDGRSHALQPERRLLRNGAGSGHD